MQKLKDEVSPGTPFRKHPEAPWKDKPGVTSLGELFAKRLEKATSPNDTKKPSN